MTSKNTEETGDSIFMKKTIALAQTQKQLTDSLRKESNKYYSSNAERADSVRKIFEGFINLRRYKYLSKGGDRLISFLRIECDGGRLRVVMKRDNTDSEFSVSLYKFTQNTHIKDNSNMKEVRSNWILVQSNETGSVPKIKLNFL